MSYFLDSPFIPKSPDRRVIRNLRWKIKKCLKIKAIVHLIFDFLITYAKPILEK